MNNKERLEYFFYALVCVNMSKTTVENLHVQAIGKKANEIEQNM